MRRESGFTLIELLIVMAIFGMVIAGVTQMFTSTLTQFKQQGKIAESNIEGIIGLELLRVDIENAGFGLPWRMSSGVSYAEASAAGASEYNDAKSSAPMDAPRALVSGDGVGTNGSDVLVIKATNVARSAASQKWTYINQDDDPKIWDAAAEDLVGSDRVIVISPGTDDGNRRTLVDSSGIWAVRYDARTGFTPGSGYNFVYGVDPDTDLRMPFNRADYYISKTEGVPMYCAPNTGVLLKSVISQNDGYRRDPMPLLDCVADMQVAFRLDRDGDGTVDSGGTPVLTKPSGGNLTAEEIRNQVKEVRVYILAHEGQKDKSYTHPTTDGKICVGEMVGSLCSFGKELNLGAEVNYRWKLYTLIVKPKNLK